LHVRAEPQNSARQREEGPQNGYTWGRGETEQHGVGKRRKRIGLVWVRVATEQLGMGKRSYRTARYGLEGLQTS
jgi:hypothetical protein